MLRFVMSGGNFIFSAGDTVPGIWLSAAGGLTASAPAGRLNTYAMTSAAVSPHASTPNLGGNFSGLIAGYATWFNGISPSGPLIAFYDFNGNVQCDLRMTGTGLLYFTRAGTAIGGTSTFALTPNAWCYIEFKAIFSPSGAGTCEVRVNGVTVLSSSGLTNAVNSNGGAQVTYFWASQSGVTGYATDFYALDTTSGANISYLGDVSIVELYPNGPGVHSAWTPNIGPFTVTAVSGSGSSWTFTGSWTQGASNAFVGYNFNTSSCGSGNNQTGVECTASAAGSITLSFSGGSVQSGLTGTLAFQAIVQSGAINQAGTRPNGDVAYISDSTTNDISDFAITPLTLTGVVLGIVHQSYLRKDDMGTRQVAQVCLSGSATEQGATISLGNTYEYFQDILEVDPNTGTQFSVSGLNAATFGIKEIT
jgi:hypothetical protein